MLGTTHLRHGEYETARREFLRSSELFAKCGEREYAGVTQALAADAEFKLGEVTGAYSTSLTALGHLRSFHGSVWVHNVLAVMADAADTDGFAVSAHRIQSEGLLAARALGQPVYVAEALLARARIGERNRFMRSSRRDLDSARAIIETLDKGFAREWLQADMTITGSMLEAPGKIGPHGPALDTAVSVFRRLKHRNRLVPALLARANARLDGNGVAEARSDLAEAADLLREHHDSIATASLRVSILGKAREVFSRAVVLAVQEGDTVGALALLERSRAAFGHGNRRITSDPASMRSYRGNIALEYLAVPDSLYIWVVRDSGLRLVARPLHGFAIADSVARLVSLLETGAAGRLTDVLLTRLHEELIRPVSDDLAPGTDIAIVGDGWVASTPWAALRNPQARRYLVEDHSVRVLNRLHSALSPEVNLEPRTISLVANPAPDRSLSGVLEPLPGSLSEIDSLRSIYVNARVLTGPAATVPAVTRSLLAAGIFHFAGHAIVDPIRPMQSYLVLSPGAAATSTGVLTAGSIQGMRFPNLRLVVLSACETARPAASADFGVNGLAMAFLAAGAKGVIGSLWRVEDQATRDLMIGFHRAYATSGSAARALRTSQLEMLRSADARYRSPDAWAGFQYVEQ